LNGNRSKRFAALAECFAEWNNAALLHWALVEWKCFFFGLKKLDNDEGYNNYE